MRDHETIDAELRLIAAIRHACRNAGGPPPNPAMIDQLLDERRGDPWHNSADASNLQAPA